MCVCCMMHKHTHTPSLTLADTHTHTHTHTHTTHSPNVLQIQIEAPACHFGNDIISIRQHTSASISKRQAGVSARETIETRSSAEREHLAGRPDGEKKGQRRENGLLADTEDAGVSFVEP